MDRRIFFTAGARPPEVRFIPIDVLIDQLYVRIYTLLLLGRRTRTTGSRQR